MIINKLKSLAVITTISIASFNIAFAADCVDDATGAYTAFGGCAMVLGAFGQTCTSNFSGLDVFSECPISCNTCPGVCGDDNYDWDETGIVGGGPDGLTYCPEDIPGCDMVENTLSLRPDGTVLYNSSDASGIYGFQIYIQGTTITAESTPVGDGPAHMGNIQFGPCEDCDICVGGANDGQLCDPEEADQSAECPSGTCTDPGDAIILGFDLDGNFIPAGSCGTLLSLSLDGTATGLNSGLDTGGNSRLSISGDGGVDLGYTYPGFWDETLSVTKVPSPDVPDLFTLGNNYPNPFNPSTAISFDVPKTISGDISLKIYDLSGKEIITLASGSYLPGKYTVNWNAVNNFGDPVASGMYVYRYVSSEQAITRKMLYMK